MQKKWYLECLAFETDIFEMMKATKILAIKDKRYEYNVTTDTKITFNKIIGNNEAIRYTCNICRTKCDAEKEKMKEKEHDEMREEIYFTIVKLKTQLEDECETVREMNRLNEELSNAINEKNKMIQQLTDEHDTPNAVTDKTNTKKSSERNGNTEKKMGMTAAEMTAIEMMETKTVQIHGI